MASRSRITMNARVMGGKPCIRGLRVTVGTILGLLASERSWDEILRLYPSLERDDIREALAWSSRFRESESAARLDDVA